MSADAARGTAWPARPTGSNASRDLPSEKPSPANSQPSFQARRIALAGNPIHKAEMIDALFRLTYFCGYRCARVVWRFTRPHVRGALVAVWHDGRVMLVRNSYRTEWSFPGGGIDDGEAPLDAAVRELSEELGWIVAPSQLHPAGEIELRWHNRNDHVTFFLLDISSPEDARIDRREVVETRFFTREDALRLRLIPHIRQLLEGRLQDGDRQPASAQQRRSWARSSSV